MARYVAQTRPHATVSYDPNVRPALMGPRDQVVPQVEHLVSLSDIVKASDEDIEWLYPGVAVDAVAKKWLRLGASVVLVTREEQGSRAWTAHAHTATSARDINVVDTVGAGDAFMSAALDALGLLGCLGAAHRHALGEVDAETLTRVAKHATTAAELTVARPGAALPHRLELPAPVPDSEHLLAVDERSLAARSTRGPSGFR